MDKPYSSSPKLQDIFSEFGNKLDNIEYRHPAEKEILEEAKAILSQTNTGKHLIAVANERKYPIHVIKHNEVRGYAVSEEAVYLTSPANKNKAEPVMVIELTAALRELEQKLMGYNTPGADADPLEFAAMSHAKNLDIVVYMCRVAYELSQQSPNSEEYVDAKLVIL